MIEKKGKKLHFYLFFNVMVQLTTQDRIPAGISTT